MSELLTPVQQQVLEYFSKSLLKDRFYWTGGTALAVVYLRHRRSQDLDFFSDIPFSYNEIIGFIRELKKELQLEFVEEKKVFDRWEFFLHNQDEMRLEFVHYDHPKLHERKRWNDIMVDSLDDIAANKAMALVDRREPKDVVDVYFLLQQPGYTVKMLLELGEKKFGVRFSESMFWSEALRRLETMESVKPLLFAQNEAEQENMMSKIQTYFEDHSKKFLDKTLE